MIPSEIQSRATSVSQALPASVQNDFLELFSSVLGQIDSITPGQNWVKAGGTVANSSKPPAGVGLEVAGQNGAYTLTIGNPNTQQNGVLYEVSYCATKSFATGVTTLAASSATSVTLNLPGTTYFFRVRATYDQVNWSPYSMAGTTAATSGLVSSAAVSEGGTFNQTNYMTVDSVAVGATANVRVYGTAGPQNSGVRIKGSTQSVLPSATVANVLPASQQFVGWDGQEYHLKPTLADVLADGMAPIGAVSVVGTGAPTLPTIVPYLSGGHILGYDVTNGGAGASEPYILTLGSTGGGIGATFGDQTIVAGVLISIAPGNPGSGYSGGTTVTPSGGTGGGTPGGGTASGGNGGRLTAV